MAKKKKSNRRGDDSDEEDDGDDAIVAAAMGNKAPPLPSKKGDAVAQPPPKKGGKKGASDKAAPAATAAAADDEPKQSRKQKKNAKQQAKKSSNNKHDDDDDNDDDDVDGNLAALMGGLMGKNKNKKKAAAYGSDSDDDDDDENVPKKPAAAASKKNKKKGGRAVAVAAAAAYSSDSDDDDDEDSNAHKIAPPAPAAVAASSKKNKKKEGRAAAVVVKAGPSPMEESSEEEEEDTTENAEVEQVAVMLADDDDWGMSSSKKKKKEEKKEKKDKKEKKHKKDKEYHHEHKKDKEHHEHKKKSSKKDKKKEHLDDESSSNHSDDDGGGGGGKKGDSDEAVPAAAAAPAAATAVPTASQQAGDRVGGEAKKKSKFELQMEAAMKKKEEEGGAASASKEAAAAAAEEVTAVSSKQKKNTSKAVKEEPEPEPDWVDLGSNKKIAGTVIDPDDDADAKEEEKEEDFYGAPDDAVWTDKSHAMKDAEKAGEEGDEEDGDLTHGPDGKKLSNKQRKALLKARAAAEREAAYEASTAKASREGAQFACSQTAVNESDQNWENSLDISIPSFSISAAGKILFKDAVLAIGHGRRYGLVGPNGKGKSTLLKMIASRDLKLPPRIDFLYVEQEVVADDTPAVEAVLRADQVRWELMEEEKHLMQAVDDGDESEEKITRLQQVVDALTNMGADAAESKARRILFGLGFTAEMQTKPTKMFSGGWRMRISLARALFVEPTLLMLDEPTNHLDLNAVIWLDEYLQKWKKTLLVVSHDQDFLNSVCEEILHIEDLKLISYKGNYDSFKKMEKIKFEQNVKAWEKQEKRLRELKRSGQSKEKAQETVKKSAKQKDAVNQKKKNQAIAAGTETAEASELIKRPREYQVKIEFSEVNELGRPVMEVSNVHFRYSPKHPVIFDRVDFGVDMDSRVTIVGPNGAGKSTLIKLLTGELEPTTGEVKRNSRLRMGVYNQHFVDRLPMTKTPVEFLRDSFPNEDYQSIRNRLGKYGLEGHAHEVTMRDLSGGQKARVVFVDLSLQKPHLLLLDEPTNNLDIETIDALCDAINAFNGGVVVVTHDQRLIEECECTLWVVEKKGVTEWKAGFDDYKENILAELEREVERQASARRQKLEAASVARAEKLARLAKKVVKERKMSH